MKSDALADLELLPEGSIIAGRKSLAELVSPGFECLPRVHTAYLRPRSHKSGCIDERHDLSENAACLDQCYRRRKLIGAACKIENGRKASKDRRPSRIQPGAFINEGEQARRYG